MAAPDGSTSTARHTRCLACHNLPCYSYVRTWISGFLLTVPVTPSFARQDAWPEEEEGEEDSPQDGGVLRQLLEETSAVTSLEEMLEEQLGQLEKQLTPGSSSSTRGARDGPAPSLPNLATEPDPPSPSTHTTTTSADPPGLPAVFTEVDPQDNVWAVGHHTRTKLGSIQWVINRASEDPDAGSLRARCSLHSNCLVMVQGRGQWEQLGTALEQWLLVGHAQSMTRQQHVAAKSQIYAALGRSLPTRGPRSAQPGGQASASGS